MVKFATITPVLLTAILIGWTASVYDYSRYGTWHVYPALAILPLIIVWHLLLIFRAKPRMPLVVYALAHCAILIPVWIGCLMLISKDSL